LKLKIFIFCAIAFSLAYPLLAAGNPDRDMAIQLALDRLEKNTGGQQEYGYYRENEDSGVTFPAISIPGAYSQPAQETRFIRSDLVGNTASELGTEVSHITYKEPGVMQQTGVMHGFNASYSYYGWLPPLPEWNDKSMLRLEARYSYGKVDYKNSGTVDNIKDYMIEGRGLIGYVFQKPANFSIIPYLGFGYRYLNDDMGGKESSTGASGYERESNYVYIPIGAELNTSLNSGWFLGTTLEFDIFVKGKQISRLSDVDPECPDISNRQRNGYGLRGSLKIQRKLENIFFVFEPFIRYWNIKRSEDTYFVYNNSLWYGVEPRNNSLEYGLKLGLKF